MLTDLNFLREGTNLVLIGNPDQQLSVAKGW